MLQQLNIKEKSEKYTKNNNLDFKILLTAQDYPTIKENNQKLVSIHLQSLKVKENHIEIIL